MRRVNMLQILKVTLLIFLISGCGYRPVSHYARSVTDQSVYISTQTFKQDPENSVLIRDALSEALQIRMGVRPVKEDSAKTSLKLELDKLTFLPLQFDRNGYVVFYRTIISMNVIASKEKEPFKVMGHFDFPVEPNAIITDSLRFEAIEKASLKAIDSLISQLAVRGLLGAK